MKANSVLAFTAAVIGLAVPVYAQAPAPSPSSLRVQVRTMENVFVTAVAGGVQQIAQKITEAAPGLTVVSGVPRAHGYAIEGHGWFFDIEVPLLRWATIELYADAQRPQPQPPQMSVGNSRRTPVAPAVIQTPDTAQLHEDYDKAIRECLMDAILDFGQVPLNAGESLTVGARSADSALPGLDTNDTVTLVLQITGEDLSLYRQTKITREEAKKRIKVKEDHR
jgi:hypothetical protein